MIEIVTGDDKGLFIDGEKSDIIEIRPEGKEKIEVKVVFQDT